MLPCSPVARSLALAGVLAGAALVGSSCAEMRQNWRSEFVSYRGAWFCGKPGCDEAQMQRSSRAHREGDLTVNHGKLANGVALVFSAGKPPDTMTAEVSDCKGKSAPVPGDKLKAPGSHGIAGQKDAWVVRVDRDDYPDLELDKGCKKWTVSTHATWPKGKWEQKGAIENE
jgi:hypothetical protein